MPANQVAASWLDDLQSNGRYTFTTEMVGAAIKRSPAATRAALRRLIRKGRIVSPRRGFHVIVPPEYRISGSPPASWFVDDLMGYLGQPYYVGLLSAAAIHGAAHQQPMVFQVVTDKPTRPVTAGNVSLEFLMSSVAARMPAASTQTETGTMRVATPETTAFDLIRYRSAAGHLDNVATVLRELAEHLDADALVAVAELLRLPDAQRLGFMLDAIGEGRLADSLAAWLAAKGPRTVPLVPGRGARVTAENRWRVGPNVDLDGDL